MYQSVFVIAEEKYECIIATEVSAFFTRIYILNPFFVAFLSIFENLFQV